jgi:hypothetical protein
MNRTGAGGCIPQLQIVVQVAVRRPRAAICAARLVAPLPERSPTAIPWRERPPELTPGPAKPAATDVVAHATQKDVGSQRQRTFRRGYRECRMVSADFSGDPGDLRLHYPNLRHVGSSGVLRILQCLGRAVVSPPSPGSPSRSSHVAEYEG